MTVKSDTTDKPQRQRADDTRRKILDAARKLFVEHGYAGTSMGKIASLAEVNHSLIFHHFGNKQKLWYAVKVDIVDTFTGSHTRLPPVDQPLRPFLEQLLKNNDSFYRHEDLARMLGWQRLERSEGVTLGAVKSEEMDRWIAAFTHFQQSGEINPELKVGFIITMVLGIASSAAMDPIIFIRAKNDRKAYYDFCVDCLMQALATSE
ncbi:MAG: TetR/AcrR family transcriptional regulator [Coxiellaceae bacterium]|nr:TetR/AcrR family transcriptional regulator [Coxiellaceae bacterium]